MPEIEFVEPDPDQGADEELSAGPTRERSPRVTRAVRVAAGAVLAVVVGSVLVAVLQHGGGDRKAAAGGSSTLPVRSSTLIWQTPQPSFDPQPDTPEPSDRSGLQITVDCPVIDACQIELAQPPAVLAALRVRLGSLRHVMGASVLVTGRTPALRDRQVSARAGRLTVRVAIAPAAAGARRHSSSSSGGTGTTVSATAVERGFTVTVTVSGPAVQAPALSTVEALAADRRLLTVG